MHPYAAPLKARMPVSAHDHDEPRRVAYNGRGRIDPIDLTDQHAFHHPIIRRNPMLVVHVFVHVKPESVEAFKAASMENARNSVQEPGIARFDVLQQQDDPTRFMLIEVYRGEDDPARHKQTAHYAAWRDSVADMMAEPRTSVKYSNVFPDESGWDMPKTGG
jgi:autoinducer 2-degrading protein